jgi:site-specific DNA-methyltransferase (adenine-specific)/modification methylase
LILDNTFGSGSFLVAAALEGRNFVGVELNEETILHQKEAVNLIDIARNRIEKIAPELKVKIYGKS